MPEALAADQGLDSAQVAAQRVHGFNDIVVDAGAGWRELARDTARDPMLWFLVGTAALFAVVGDTAEALTLLAALVPLVGMDAFLHQRTRASTAGLASRLAATARVLRDGVWVDRPSRELVPGDLVQVEPGEYVPADGLVVGGSGLQVDESTLTGESMAVTKRAWPSGAALREAAHDDHWAVAGTRLLTGTARVRVVYIGVETRYGEIVRSVSEGSHGRTPLQAAIGQLVRGLLVAALLLCVVLAATRLAQGHGLVDALLSALTLAVAALPEEFPVVYTFFLGLGVYRLARRKALVRRAVAVENIGRVTCIASDKTGTITAGDLVLAHRLAAKGHDDGELLGVAARASRPDSGDPVDHAIAVATQAAGAGGPPGERLTVFPFTEQRRRETALWREAGGPLIAVTKGAPETVFASCELAADEAARWRRAVEDFAAGGHKVIACAAREWPDAASTADEPIEGFRLAGLLAFEDPVRAGVREAVAECLGAGMRVIMVTGDHPATAAAIAREVGLGGGDPAVVVLQPDDDAAAALAAAPRLDVVARATPSQKLALVQALQAQGETVAVTGDGVNDVPALQRADIGIAMGERGTRSAREVAPVVLLDDNFRTIVQAVGEGRQLFDNLRLSFAYLLLVHFPLVFSAALIPLMGWPLLYLPIHIVWLELVIHPTAMLAFQDLPARGPLGPVRRGVQARFFSPLAWWVLALGGGALTALVVGGYHLAPGADANDGGDVGHARAMAMALLVVSSAAIAAGLTRLGTTAARVVVAAQLATLVVMIQVPGLGTVLHLQPLHAADWAWVATVGVLIGVASLVLSGRVRRVGAAGARPALRPA
ncbi:MAG: cation-transporting P-type ATPase [Ideonella sp.]|jgi:Ca2+-transporting ATPase|nr:cation-transporting P-type ATPase [Ideonella sp.]